MKYEEAKNNVIARIRKVTLQHALPSTYLTKDEYPYAQKIASDLRKEYDMSYARVDRVDDISGNVDKWGYSAEIPKGAVLKNAICITTNGLKKS